MTQDKYPESIREESRGWTCSDCKNVVQEHYNQRPYVCPICGSHNWSGLVRIVVAKTSAFVRGVGELQ